MKNDPTLKVCCMLNEIERRIDKLRAYAQEERTDTIVFDTADETKFEKMRAIKVKLQAVVDYWEQKEG